MNVGLPVCEPYLESACKIATEKLGRVLEKGVYTTTGCYYYKSGKYATKFATKVYFGLGGNLQQNKDVPKRPGQFRPRAFDCNTGICRLINWKT